MTGWDDTFWLTKQWRVDRDAAVYGEVTFDATDKLSFTGGGRYFETENSLEGFFGFGITNPYDSGTGEAVLLSKPTGLREPRPAPTSTRP